MNDQLKKATDQITLASMDYRIWRIYTEPRDHAKYLKVLEKYILFVKTSRHAHLLATIIELYGLYETRPDSISLSRLVKDTPDDKLRRGLQPMLEEACGIWRKIAILRSEVAHLCDTDTDAAFRRANLSPNEIERLIELSKQLANRLSLASDRSASAFNLDPATDTYNLLDSLLRIESR